MNADDAWKEFCDFDDTQNAFGNMVGTSGGGGGGGGGSCGISGAVQLNNYKQNTSMSEEELFAVPNIPECSPIYISTKTKIGYLNQSIPLEDMFWAIDVLPSYSIPVVGIVKKEMKFKTVTQDALNVLIERIKSIPEGPYVQQNIKTHMEEQGNMQFKDVRKVSVGLCKKQMSSFRTKVKGAFFNCFALILRMKWEGQFKEMHVKVFNTGKLEIPGIPGKNTDEFLECVLSSLVDSLKPISDKLGLKVPIDYRRDYNETVLTNSNFTANYLVDRERLSHILRQHYRILTTYDPCSYPGVQSKFYYVEERAIQDGRPLTDEEIAMNAPFIVVPVMIFRTGSVLIVGKFDDDVLMWVYDFIKSVLRDQYYNIQTGLLTDNDTRSEIVIPRKSKKRFISITTNTNVSAS